MMTIEETNGYKMGRPAEREHTHSLFIDNMKMYQENHESLKEANEIIARASSDAGALYRVNKCAQILFVRGKMVEAEGLQVLGERMEAL